MEASELRLGSKVETFKGNVESVTGIYTTEDYVEISTDTCVGVIEDYKPIPLTEEWLLKFGFQFIKCGQDINNGKYCHWNYWALNGFVIRSRNGRFGFNGEVKDIDIKHVHQLQNLHFALTGEELNA
jgi:hypothetical protein